MVKQFTLPVVKAYMKHVQDNAAESVRRVLDRLPADERRGFARTLQRALEGRPR